LLFRVSFDVHSSLLALCEPACAESAAAASLPIVARALPHPSRQPPVARQVTIGELPMSSRWRLFGVFEPHIKGHRRDEPSCA